MIIGIDCLLTINPSQLSSHSSMSCFRWLDLVSVNKLKKKERTSWSKITSKENYKLKIIIEVSQYSPAFWFNAALDSFSINAKYFRSRCRQEQNNRCKNLNGQLTTTQSLDHYCSSHCCCCHQFVDNDNVLTRTGLDWTRRHWHRQPSVIRTWADGTIAGLTMWKYWSVGR